MSLTTPQLVEQIAVFVEGVTQKRQHPFFAGLDGTVVDAEGYEDLTRTERQLLRSVARAIRKRFNEPDHT